MLNQSGTTSKGLAQGCTEKYTVDTAPGGEEVQNKTMEKIEQNSAMTINFLMHEYIIQLVLGGIS